MKIYVLGEDNRSKCLRKIYDTKISIEEANVIICPIPFTRDNIKINTENIDIDDFIKDLKDKNKIVISGVLNENIRNKFAQNNIRYYDLMEYEEFSIMNAIATSEGAIKKAIEMTNFTLNKSNILILGYGRIGKILAHNLSGFGANIYCEARKKKDIALIKSIGYNDVDLKQLDSILPNMDIIFNTIPYLLLDSKRIDTLKKNVCIIDLASAPGGIDFEYCSKKGINVSWYLAIPSKDSPYSAAIYIKEIVDNILGEEDNGRKD